MQLFGYILALLLLIPEWALSGGVRGKGVSVGASGRFVHSGGTSAVRPRLGALTPSMLGRPTFIPHSAHSGVHFRRGPFARFTFGRPVVGYPFYRPFIYYPPYLHHWSWSGSVYPYHPGVAIVEVPNGYDSRGSHSLVPRLPTEDFTPAPLLAEPPARTLPGQVAPFDPTPQDVVDRMLNLAGIKNGDVLYDLGSGDGRVLIAAAKKYGVKAVGFEVDPGLVKLARENIQQAMLEQLVEIRHQDFTTADLSSASVVTLYLSQDGNEALKPILQRQLQPGARVVSYTFDMDDWPPKITEAYRDQAGNVHTLYFWEVAHPPIYSEKPQ
jgi:SAM-dependent methyltransferase